MRNILSEIEEVRGTEPVSRTTIIPKVNKVIPRDREKYSSITGNLSIQVKQQGTIALTSRLASFWCE